MSYTDTETVTEIVDIESLDLSTEDTIPVERTFIGQVTQDQKEPGKYGPQYHLAVKPLSFTLNSESGSFHDWLAIKFSAKDGSLVTNGDYGRVVAAIRNVFGKSKIGEGEILGKIAHFTLRKLEYKNDKTGEVFGGKRDHLIAVRKATEDELAALGTPGQTPSAPAYSDADVRTLLDLMAGKKVLEYTRGLGRLGVKTDDPFYGRLSAELKNAVMNGTAATTLVTMGVAELVDNVLQEKVAA